MISEKLQNAINEQITAEMWSANLYLAMSFYFEKEGFSGFAHWMKKQSQEEMGHAYAMADYITSFLDLVNNALCCSFFFYLFANKSPQEILCCFILFSSSYVYQLVYQLRNMTFMFVYVFEYLQRSTPSVRNNIYFIYFSSSSTFDDII